jgi:predicted nuclease of restriction endonuclease-like (RecB) superfamily
MPSEKLEVDIRQTVSAESDDRIAQTPSAQLAGTILQSPIEESGPEPPFSLLDTLRALSQRFPLPWSHYVRLLSVKNPLAREFYEIEALRGGWTVKQLNRQIGTQFYERTALSRNKAAMLTKGQQPKPEDVVSVDEEIKDSFVLEFLGWVGPRWACPSGAMTEELPRRSRLPRSSPWGLSPREPRLRSCSVIRSVGTSPTGAKAMGERRVVAGQSRLRWDKPHGGLARSHWEFVEGSEFVGRQRRLRIDDPDENPPVGIIRSLGQGDSLVRYALEGLPNPTLVREYRLLLPDEKLLADELTRTRRLLEARLAARTTRRKT